MYKFNCSVVIVAGGTGKRMGTSIKKQYMMLGNMPILARTIDCFQKCDYISDIVIVTGIDEVEFCKKEIVDKFNFDKVKKIVAGGKERQYSVYNGLCALSENTDIVLIHDGVRPFIRVSDVKKIIEETAKFDCCVLGVKVKDTIKICKSDDFINDTPNRNDLWIAQTPQAFKFDLIMKAYKNACDDEFLGTDDSMLAEREGYKVKMTEGSYDNIKITTAEDLYIGEAILKNMIDNEK